MCEDSVVVATVSRSYSLVVTQEGNVCIALFEGVLGGVVPGDVVNPVGFVVVPANQNGAMHSFYI